MDASNIGEKLLELQEYAELDGTEWGELIQGLEHLYHYRDYMSSELAEALNFEIDLQWSAAKEFCVIVQNTETTTHTTRELIWK